ncbi:MAG: enoyl-CoA hydratase-related protein [Pseudomonadota bacterium]
MQFKTLLFDVKDSVAHITLNRPEAANTINIELARELMYAAMQCDEDPLIRAVLITGAGPMFCGGGDLKSFGDQGENLPRHLKDITTYLHVAMSYLVRMDPPAVAAVHGSAAGAGLSIACACDIVLAAESARFTMAYTRAGLTPDGGSTYTLPRLVGLKRALELALTNRLLSAEEALNWGIVIRVVPEKDLITEAKALAGQLAAGPTKTFGATKRLFQSGLTESFETQMKNESRSIAEMTRTEDGREGISAFLGKRAPNFKGR